MALLMSGERPEALPGLNIPQFQGLVARSAYKVAGVVGVELDIKNCATAQTTVSSVTVLGHP